MQVHLAQIRASKRLGLQTQLSTPTILTIQCSTLQNERGRRTFCEPVNVYLLCI